MDGNDTLNETIKKNAGKWDFFLKRFQEAASANNFPLGNPEVFHKITETSGANLLEGWKRLQRDLSENKASFLNIPLTDTPALRVGEDLADTPGSVIFQNDLIQLIHYQPAGSKAYAHPLLFIPPWINKFYILDLGQQNSMVRWLLSQGMDVYMISWVNPDKRYRTKTFSDYLTEGPLAAINAITETTGKEDLNLAGYCIGGTLLACLMATLADNGCRARIHSATFFAALLDFSAPGDLGLFIDEPELALLEKEMQEKGYMDGALLAAIFSLLRAGDLIWPAWVNHYLKNEPLPVSPILRWNSDSTHIPEAAHRFYLRNLYQHNQLATPSLLRIAEMPVDLSRITQPLFFVAAERDHIAPWQSCYTSSRLIPYPAQFLLAGAGHVAGIINPPSKNRYGYRLSLSTDGTPQDFLNHAVYTEGSWWPAWFKWLEPHAGKSHAIKKIHKKNILEAAPGSYVKVTLEDIARRESGMGNE